MRLMNIISMLVMLTTATAVAQQRTQEEVERGLKQMEQNGEIKREGNKIIFLKIAKGETAFFGEMYHNMLKDVKGNPYTISFSLPSNNKMPNNALPIKDTTKNYQVVQSPVEYNRTIKYSVVAFEAYTTERKPGSLSVIEFDNISYNYGNGFSLSPSVFTAPSTGLYQFSIGTTWNGFGTASGSNSLCTVGILKNNSVQVWSASGIASYLDGEYFSVGYSFSTKLNAGDQLKVTNVNILSTSRWSVGVPPALLWAKFSGYRIVEL
jgi:C1q domain